jgi:uncharacterized protein (TIGR00369 family)
MPINETKINQEVLARIEKIPIFKTLSFEIEELRNGTCTAYVPRRKEYDGIFETFHGGILMTIADSISAFAILTLTGADKTIATTDMNIRFLAPCRTGVRAIAKTIKFGKTLCPVAIDLFDEENRLVAVAQVTYMIIN